MASVAKRLRQWIVIPPFAGSSPVVRPFCTLSSVYLRRTRLEINVLAVVVAPERKTSRRKSFDVG